MSAQKLPLSPPNRYDPRQSENSEELSGFIVIHEGQAERLNLKAHTRLSGLLEKACLQLSAKESFQAAEADIEMLTELLWAFNSTAISASTDV